MINNKKIQLLTMLSVLLAANVTIAKDNNLTHPATFETTDFVEDQMSYFNDYWNKVFSNKHYQKYYGIHNKFITQDKEYIMILEIPGFDKNQVKVKLNNNRILVSGEVKKEDQITAVHDNKYMGQNSFNFSFSLNDDVDKEKITSNLKNGILTIIMPRLENNDANSKEITVN